MYSHLPLCSPCPWDKILHCKTHVFLNVKKYQNHPNVTWDHTLADARSNIALEISYFIKPQWTSLFNKSEWISFPEIQWWIWWNFQNLSLIYYFFSLLAYLHYLLKYLCMYPSNSLVFLFSESYFQGSFISMVQHCEQEKNKMDLVNCSQVSEPLSYLWCLINCAF